MFRHGFLRQLPRALALASIPLLLFAISCARADRDPAPEDEFRQAVNQFYEALDELLSGNVGPMEEVWSHADDVFYMGPNGGLFVGWDQVHTFWVADAKKKIGGKVQPEKLHVVATDQLAFTVGYERGTEYPDGEPLPINIRATNVFRREAGAWRMIAHHTDLFPHASNPK